MSSSNDRLLEETSLGLRTRVSAPVNLFRSCAAFRSRPTSPVPPSLALAGAVPMRRRPLPALRDLTLVTVDGVLTM